MALILDEMGFVIGHDGDTSTDTQIYPETETATAPIESGFIARKIAEFQKSIDDAVIYVDSLYYLQTLELSEVQRTQVDDKIAQFESRKSAMKFAAEALNTTAGLANGMGASMPTVRIPSGLGFAILGVPVATAATLAGMAVLVLWISSWIASTDSMVLDIIESLPEPQKTDAKMRHITALQTGGVSGAISDSANMIKWVAIAAIAYYGYQAYKGSKS